MQGNFWKVPKLSLSHISQSQWWNYESITVMNLLVIITIQRNYSESYFLQNWIRIIVWIINDFIKKYLHITYGLFTISHLHTFGFIFCVDLVTPESLWCHKGVALHVTYKTMHRFSTMHDSPPPALEFRLQISDTSVHSALRASCTDWSSWSLWPLRASDLTMHDTSYLNPYHETMLCTVCLVMFL